MAARMLARALVDISESSCPSAQDVYLNSGDPSTTFKVLYEMAFGHVQTGAVEAAVPRRSCPTIVDAFDDASRAV